DRDRGQRRAVLGLSQPLGGEPALGVGRARLQQLGRPQQAADVLRVMPGCHVLSPSLVIISSVRYDPSLFEGTAAHYVRGRPAYSRALAATLAAELGLDGTGRLLDAGCGPGILTLQLASRFGEAV